MAWYYVTILCLAAFWFGYFVKDQVTDEYVSNVTIHKPKVKKGGTMELDQVVEVEHKKKTLLDRIRRRREQRKARRRVKKAAKKLAE